MRAVAVLKQTPRSQWAATAERLAHEFTVRLGGGFSKKRILDLFRDYRAKGPEALLLNYGKRAAKPEAFVTDLARRVEENKRVASVALDELHADWFSGKSIPGYGTWRERWAEAHADEAEPAACPKWFVPQGWDSRNLRRYLPAEAEMEFARRGMFAAHGLMPQKRNDYRSLRPLEVVVFDDVRCDWLVSYPGVDHACEMWLLVAMDACSRRVLDWVSLARVPDDAGKRAEFIGEHMLILAGNLLRQHGIPQAYPMTLKVENAKATISREKADYLAVMAGNQIAVDYTRMHNRALPSGHTERHGTPWDIKGILESFFRTFHDHTAQLPGTTGARYELAPAELKGRQEELKAIMKAAEGLPEDVVAQLRLPFLRYDEAVDVVMRVIAHLNARTEHRLQGFERVQSFRFPKDLEWRPVDELKRYPQAMVREAIFQTRLESPDERFARLRRAQPDFVCVPDDALLPLMARSVKRVRHPAPHTIAWSEAGVEWTFRSTKIPELASGRGGPFSAKYLPHDVNTAWLYDDAGRRLGVLSRLDIPLINDEEAQKHALGEVQHARSLVIKPVMERHAGARVEREENKRLNDAIIAAARGGRAMAEDAAESRRVAKKQDAATQRRNAQRMAQLAANARSQMEAVSNT